MSNTKNRIRKLVTKGYAINCAIKEEKKQPENIKSELTKVSKIQRNKISQIARKLKVESDVLNVKIAGDSWVQKNWYALLMLMFAGLIGIYCLGFASSNVSDGTISDLLFIIKLGLGGYVIERNAKKIVKEYKK